MHSQYEIENIYLARSYSKARKLLALDALGLEDTTLYNKIKKNILDGQTKKAVMDSFEDTESEHWVNFYGRAAAADLLCIGKVQPETMISMSHLTEEDFKKAVKIATNTARQLDNDTMRAESELNVNKIPKELI